MRVFHIDMNMAQHRADYLERWFVELARLGYTHLLWEVENNVRWDSCPECCSPDAFSKAEFQGLVQRSRELGLEPIPLLQTIGHAEYVLKHEAYAPLKELPERIDQYCPLKPAVHELLARWIDEYCELFGAIDYFHLGADEAYALGHCPECSAFAAEHSLSQLYIEHMNRVCARVLARGIRPVIWSDMLLNHPEALELLSREIVLCDWDYRAWRGRGWVNLRKPWGGAHRSDRLPAAAHERFGRWLFPFGDELGREAEPFYSVDFLADQGFDVLTCPAATSHGDSCFAPRTGMHLHNTWDSFAKGAEPRQSGSLLTSWSQRFPPWELQLGSIAAPAFQRAYPGASIADFHIAFADERFGLGAEFWRACALLSEPCPLSEAAELGIGKDCIGPSAGHVARWLHERVDRLPLEAERATAAVERYRQAERAFEELFERAERGHEILAQWRLAARCSRQRAEAAELIIGAHEAVRAAVPLAGEDAQRARDVLDRGRLCRAELAAAYLAMYRPTRAAEMIDWCFTPIEEALAGLCGAPVAQPVSAR